MRILFCGGGTGGHITPSLAIAEELKRKYKACEIAFIGRKNGNENKLITDKDYPLYEIEISGFSRSMSINNLKTIGLFIKSRSKAIEILTDYKPDAVIGTGGYVCAPVISAAKKLNIPSALHESNASFGLTTKLMARKCDILMLGANVKTKYKNAVYTGNPVSDRFGKIQKTEAKQKLGLKSSDKLILSVGGSIGAEKLNEAVIDFMYKYAYGIPGVYHIHSAGKRYYDEVSKNHPDLCQKTGKMQILPFIYDMPTYISAADIVISRCGAMTLAEISKVGRPAIMIPSPNVTNNHQMKNALYYQSNGAGEILEENKLNSESIAELIKSILHNEKRLASMTLASKNLYNNDSKSKIAELIVNLLKSHNNSVV